MHVDWKLDTEGWLTGVITLRRRPPGNGGRILGPADDLHRVGIRAKITSFLRNRPDLMHRMPSDPVTAGKSWPSPRSWTNAMAVLDELPPDDEDAALLVLTGCVGAGAATEYLAWAATASLYDPSAVLADPSIVDWRRSRPDSSSHSSTPRRPHPDAGALPQGMAGRDQRARIRRCR